MSGKGATSAAEAEAEAEAEAKSVAGRRFTDMPLPIFKAVGRLSRFVSADSGAGSAKGFKAGVVGVLGRILISGTEDTAGGFWTGGLLFRARARG